MVSSLWSMINDLWSMAKGQEKLLLFTYPPVVGDFALGFFLIGLNHPHRQTQKTKHLAQCLFVTVDI